MNLLFLTTVLPANHQKGGEVATNCILRALQESGHTVTVMGYLRPDDDEAALPQNAHVIEVRPIETSKAGRQQYAWWLVSLGKALPYSAAKYFSQRYREHCKQLLATAPFDAVILDHAQLGWLQSVLPADIPLVFVAHNVEHRIYQGNAREKRNPLARGIYQREAKLMEKVERQIASQALQVWALTEADAKYFAQIPGVSKAYTLPIAPNSHRLPDPNTGRHPHIALIGSWSWQANRDALQWFLQEVCPLLPDTIEIQIAGPDADDLLKEFDRVQYVGFVPDAQAFMAAAQVVAIPSVHGSGIQIKTLEAIASGASIVATSVALRGIDAPPATVQVADTAEEFAACLRKRIQSPEQGGEIAQQWYRDRNQQLQSIVKTSLENLS